MPGNATRENTAALSFAIEAARRKNRKAAREAGESIDGAALPAKDALVYLCQRDLATGDEIAAIAGEAQARAESDSSDSAGNTTGVETPEASRTAQRALEKIGWRPGEARRVLRGS